LLATLDRIANLTAEVAAKRQGDALEMELHNHIDKMLYDLGRFDPSPLSTVSETTRPSVPAP
jgi:hypothetical protein